MHYLPSLLTVVALGALVPGAEFARPLVCYYEGWSAYRAPPNKGDPAKIPVDNACTHIVYAFMGLDEGSNTVKYLDTWQDLDKGAIAAFVGLKSGRPQLKATFAIGGWNEGSTKYSRMASSDAGRNAFARSIADMINKHGFDGVDIDWEYPTDRGGAPVDRENFVLLLRAIRSAIGSGKLITIAVSANPNLLATIYDVPAISQIVDFIHVMAYDLRGSWDPTADNHALLNGRPTDSALFKQINVRSAMAAWAGLGAPKNKLIMGFGFYGRSFTLASASQNAIGSPATGGGSAGPVSQQSGILFYMEICQKLNEGWTRKWDSVGQVPYAFQGNQWVGYDDPEGFRYKVDLINSEGYGGAMVWAVGTDDISGSCGKGAYPLLTSLSGLLNGGSPGPVPTQGPDPVTRPTEKPTSKPVTPPSPGGPCERTTYPHAVSCRKFYLCGPTKSNMAEMSCPPGTVFNENIGNCDWPANTHRSPASCTDFS